MIWDKIIQTKEEAILKLKDQKSEYFLVDQGSGLRFFSFIN